MDELTHVIGIDFGTSNSYFCRYFIGDCANHKIRAIDFGNEQIGSISSNILYTKDEKILVGEQAIQEWGDATTKEKATWKFHTHFKPDIVKNVEAKKCAIDYLKTIKINLQSRKINFFPDQQTVIMGIPSNADNAYLSALKDIAKESGYGMPEFLPEPVGALLYHLWNQDISPKETTNGILVVDFGGGTCDFSFLQHLKVRHSWGDMSFGGRLFDDLFYQWFLDQNPEAEKILNERDKYFIHWFECRRIKEDFSNRIQNSKNVIIPIKNVWNNYTLKDLSWKEFQERANNYIPHKSFQNYIEETNQNQHKLKDNSKLDLINWFNEALMNGIEKYNIRVSDIDKVILTGGSTQWLFVQESINDLLHLDPNQVLGSDNPKAAIAEGLVVYPQLKQNLNVSKKMLSEGLDDFLQGVKDEIEENIIDQVRKISQKIANMIFDNKISQRLINFKENGGTIKSLEENIEGDIKLLEPEIINITATDFILLKEGLPEQINKKTIKWFKDNGIKIIGKTINFKTDNVRPSEIKSTDDFYKSIFKYIELFLTSLSGVIVASIAGGAGIALIAEGPVGWIIGLVIGLIVMLLPMKKMREKVKSINFKPTITNRLITKEKVLKIAEKGKRKVEEKLIDEINNSLYEPLEDLIGDLELFLKEEINNLDVINNS